MTDIEGVYTVKLLGPYGWENFSTAFIEDGSFQSASAEHFTTGCYQVEGDSFNMAGSLTQHTESQALFGNKSVKGFPIVFNGKVEKGVINGEIKSPKGGNYLYRFRLSRLPVLSG